MSKIKLKKLSLNKETIARLHVSQSLTIKGGARSATCNCLSCGGQATCYANSCKPQD